MDWKEAPLDAHLESQWSKLLMVLTDYRTHLIYSLSATSSPKEGQWCRIWVFTVLGCSSNPRRSDTLLSSNHFYNTYLNHSLLSAYKYLAGCTGKDGKWGKEGTAGHLTCLKHTYQMTLQQSSSVLPQPWEEGAPVNWYCMEVLSDFSLEKRYFVCLAKFKPSYKHSSGSVPAIIAVGCT